MNTTNRFKLLIATAALSFSAITQAAVFGNVQHDQSQVSFTFEQMGVQMDGQFRQFQGELSFDSAQPEQGQVTLTVELGSVDVGAPAFNEEVIGKDWFNTPAFPTATFTSKAIKPLGEQRYEVQGELTIKGQTHNVTVPATFTETQGLGVFTGVFTLERGAFNIGEGSWSKFDIVANPVVVNFKITASPLP